MSKTLVNAVSLMVRRDAMTNLPVSVPAYEGDILRLLHGEENVVERDDKAQPVEIEAATEADRLDQKYGKGSMSALLGPGFKSKVARMVQEATVREAKPKAAKQDA